MRRKDAKDKNISATKTLSKGTNMRRFHSYGPVNEKSHFMVKREKLVKHCFESMIGTNEEGGHYFTIWAPRQTGKTWLLRQVQKKIEAKHGDQFIVASMSMQGVIPDDDGKVDFPDFIPELIRDAFGIKMGNANPAWRDWKNLFHKKQKHFDRPLILFIDEFDSLPPAIIDRLVTLFRDMYLKRESYLLHGLALIGVRAVLGVESERGSPFNIQRSLHVPNFTFEEVKDLYHQYQEESGQKTEPEVVDNVYESTRGQPGLVCWFGELLTEKYNPGHDKTIDMRVWKKVYRKACYVEWNNTVLNLIKKAKTEYQREVLELFIRSDIKFTLDADWCGYLYLNGVIDSETHTTPLEEEIEICRFSSPFIQERLYNALTYELVGDRLPILALEPLDDLADVFEQPAPDMPALLARYKEYLKRLKARGINPWKEQPRRADLHLTEAVGHFHLYSWLKQALEDECIVSPEFPTGNGKVDLCLKCGAKRGIIEVKSYKSMSGVKKAKKQAAQYAKQTGLDSVAIALFIPVEDEDILAKLSGEIIIGGVKVIVCAIGWT